MAPATVAQHRRPLDVGLLLPEFSGALEGRTPRWADLRAMAKTAEQVGFDSIWTFDELLWRFEGSDPIAFWENWSVLAAVAEATSRARVGSLITCANYRNPALLAKMAETVDEISDGRLVLGIGAGWSEDQFRMFGFPFDHRFERFEEALRIIHDLLRTGRADFEGRYQQARDLESLPRGPRPNRIPILIGGMGPRMLSLAARYADEWNTWIPNRSRPEELAAVCEALDAACRAADRDPASLRRSAGIAVGLGDVTLRIGPVDWTAGAVRGSSAEIAARLRSFAEAEIAEVQIALAPFGLRSIEAFRQVFAALEAG